MKTIARCVTALAVLALATPALPCADKAMKTTTAKTEKAPKDAVAKASATKDAKAATEAKPASN